MYSIARLSRSVITALSVLTYLAPNVTTAAPNDVTRVSVSSANVQANGVSGRPSVSRDGNLVAYASVATNLTAFDSNGKADIFLRNRTGGTTTLRSESALGAKANGNSLSPTLAGSGGFLAYLSDATNLVTPDTNNTAADGNFDVFVQNLTNGSVERVSLSSGAEEANGTSTEVSISDDGRYVVFTSAATNLVANDTNNARDIFLHDRQNDTTIRISQTASAVQSNGESSAPMISGDGAYVVFVSLATNLIPTDINGVADIFRYNVATKEIELVSVDSLGFQLNTPSLTPSISGNGNLIAFFSTADDVVVGDTNSTSDIFVHNMTSGVNTRVSESAANAQSNGNSISPAISRDGTRVSFLSDATNLVPFDSNNTAKDGKFDLFVKTIASGAITRENETLAGAQVSGNPSGNAIDEDGSVVTFLFDGTNLVPFDSNGVVDVFVTDTACPTDSDGDGTLNCADTCAFDDLKTTPGTCGCGVSDSDTDLDGTADCSELCTSDAAKTNPGACGCGVSDADANGNGVADCSDPKTTTVPRTATVTGGKGTVRASVTEQFSKVTYQFVLVKDGKTVKSVTTTKRSVRFSNVKRGTYRVKYRVSVGSVKSKYSTSSSVKVR